MKWANRLQAPQENHNSQKVGDEADNMSQQPLLFVNVPSGAQHTTVLSLLWYRLDHKAHWDCECEDKKKASFSLPLPSTIYEKYLVIKPQYC